MRFAQPALAAMPAIHVHLRADEVPGLYCHHFSAYALHYTAKFMSQSHRRLNPSLRPAIPSVNMQIRSADRRRLNPHQNVHCANRRHRRRLKRQSAPRAHLPQRLHSRHLLRSSLNTQSPMLAHPYLPNPWGHDTSCPPFRGPASIRPFLTAKSPPKPTHSSAAPSPSPLPPPIPSLLPASQTPPALHAPKPPQSISK